MTRCELFDSPDVDLYFYGELADADRVRVDAHLRRCDGCRQRLDDLHAIRRALADRPAIDAPPAGDWSGFMRRLDAACSSDSSEGLRPSDSPTRSLARRFTGSLRFRLRQGFGGRAEAPSARRRARGSLTAFARGAIAAMLAIVALGIYAATHARPAPVPKQAAIVEKPAVTPDAALREVSAEHLQRSKLVVLGLTALDPKQTRAADWQYERQLAGTLLDDTRLYRQMAQERGLNDVAHVMRDLETVLIETSMSDGADGEALSRVQRLIAKRDLVVKMQLVATN